MFLAELAHILLDFNKFRLHKFLVKGKVITDASGCRLSPHIFKTVVFVFFFYSQGERINTVYVVINFKGEMDMLRKWHNL